jgi:hypothetical protein
LIDVEQTFIASGRKKINIMVYTHAICDYQLKFYPAREMSKYGANPHRLVYNVLSPAQRAADFPFPFRATGWRIIFPLIWNIA